MADKRTPFDTNLGRKICMARTTNGMSQDDLARELNKSRAVISRYELGEHKITAETLARCARVLGVPVEFFLNEGKTQADISKQNALIATAITQLPNKEIQKSLYHLVCQINRAFSERDSEIGSDEAA